MREESQFGTYHPAVLFVYYGLVITIAMFTTHPVVLACVLAGGICLFAQLHPMRVTAGNLVYYFFMFLLIALCNPLFVHNGETILFFMNDNPVTFEAICYGAAIAAMITGVMFWCKNYTVILTTDKFLYLFGRILPKLSLVLSMAIRFLSLFKQQAKKIGRAQKAMGLYAGESRTDQLLGGVRTFDSLLSWGLENSLETADAMCARGYGLPGRTSFSAFTFHRRDGVMLGVIALLAALIVISWLRGDFYFAYYPVILQANGGAGAVGGYLAVFAFMMIPSFVEVKEKMRWNFLKSKI